MLPVRLKTRDEHLWTVDLLENDAFRVDRAFTPWNFGSRECSNGDFSHEKVCYIVQIE